MQKRYQLLDGLEYRYREYRDRSHTLTYHSHIIVTFFLHNIHSFDIFMALIQVDYISVTSSPLSHSLRFLVKLVPKQASKFRALIPTSEIKKKVLVQ